MSISLMKEVWDNSNAFGSDLLALLCLADQANEQGACWPSIALIGKRCRLSGRQVARLLKKLEDAKHITRVERPGHSNFYYVHPVGMTPVSPVTDQSPLTPVSPTPDMDVIPPLTPVSPRTVKEPSKNLFGDDGEKKAPKKKRDFIPLPPDFEPNDRHVALAQRLGVDLREEFGCFCDHHEAKGNTFADWDAALSLWIRKSKKMGGRAQQLPLQRPVMR